MKLSGSAEALLINLDADEQLTFLTEFGAEYDFAVKSWGAYVTPSLRGRLAAFGLRPCLIVTSDGILELALVEEEHVAAFKAEAAASKIKTLWLDNDDIKTVVAGGAV